MQDIPRTHRSLVSALLSVILLAGASTVLGGCNTTAGLGEDVSATGHAVTNSAEKVKQGL
jgi:entericidin B